VGIDPAGNVWVADGKNDRFQIFAPDGTFLEAWGTSGSVEGQFDFSAQRGCCGYDYGDVAFDASGNIYVVDTNNARVQKFSPDRAFLRAWGSAGRAPGQFVVPGGIAVGPDGTVYVSDEERGDIQKFDADGAYLGKISSFGTGDSQTLIPAGVAVDAGGDVWVADYGTQRIERFHADGAYVGSWGELGNRPGQLDSPNGVDVDAQGLVYVADMDNQRLQVFTMDGRPVAAFGQMNRDEFKDPLAVAVSRDGTIYVSDNRELQAFRLVWPEAGP
jgi:sugar lactone lactonase YvrE